MWMSFFDYKGMKRERNVIKWGYFFPLPGKKKVKRIIKNLKFGQLKAKLPNLNNPIFQVYSLLMFGQFYCVQVNEIRWEYYLLVPGKKINK